MGMGIILQESERKRAGEGGEWKKRGFSHEKITFEYQRDKKKSEKNFQNKLDVARVGEYILRHPLTGQPERAQVGRPPGTERRERWDGRRRRPGEANWQEQTF